MVEYSKEIINEAANLCPKKVLGISSDVKGNGIFSDKDNIIYACENSLVQYNLKNKTADIVLNTMMKHRNIESFSLNPQRTLIGLGIGGPESLLYFYTKKRVNKNDNYQNIMKVHFTGGQEGVRKVKFTDFSAESNFLAAIIDIPSRLCVYYLRHKAVILNLRFTSFHGRVTRNLFQVHFNPRNDKVLLLIGEGVFRVIKFKIFMKTDSCEVKFKTMGFYQAKFLTMTTASWYDEDRILSATADGRLFIVENCEIKGIYFINAMDSIFIPSLPPLITVRERINWVKVAQNKLIELDNNKNVIRQIAVFGKAFAIGKTNIIIYEEPVDRPRWFLKKHTIRIDQMEYTIHDMHSEPFSKFLTCVTNTKNIYFLDLNQECDPITADVLENVCIGNKKIKSLATCLWRPVCITLCGNHLCLWNYDTGEVLNKWSFPCELKNVSLHPSGSKFCLNLENYLGIYEIFHNHMFSHPNRSCQLKLKVFYVDTFTHCAFSDGGAYFYGATLRKMYIFSSTSFQILNVFELQISIIQSVINDRNDTLTSLTSKGSIRKYDLKTGTLICEKHLDDNLEYSEFVKDYEKKILYALGSRGCFTTINYAVLNQRPITYSLNVGELLSVAISQTSRMLYLGTENGAVLQIKLSDIESRSDRPSNIPRKEFYFVSREITKIIITPTNKLISGSNDGCLLVCDLIGPKFLDYECPHKSTDFLLGSLSLLKYITAVRKLNEETLRQWYNIKEFMINDKYMQWIESYYSYIMDDIKEIKSKLKEIEELKKYYNGVWSEMDSFWAPQAQKEVDINNNYLYYNQQFRDKENANYDAWTRGLWHIQHIDTASKAISGVLDDILEESFNKKTIQERYLKTYREVQETKVKEMNEARKKVDRATYVYRKMYILARNAQNGLQNFIMQEATHDDVTSFDMEVVKKQYHTLLSPFQEDVRLLDRTYKKHLDEVKIMGKQFAELSYFDIGPTGITMKLLPNIMNSYNENMKLKETKADDLVRYLKSQPAQWRELRRWDWLIKEWSSEYHRWFTLGQANFGNAFYNSHAFNELIDADKLKHLNKKQLLLIHNCSSHYVTLSRSLKVIEQFYIECLKLKNDVERKLSQINEDIDSMSMEEIIKKLVDVYDTINSPNKIRKDVFYLKKGLQRKVRLAPKIEYEEVCPVTPYLPKSHKLRKKVKNILRF